VLARENRKNDLDETYIPVTMYFVSALSFANFQGKLVGGGMRLVGRCAVRREVGPSEEQPPRDSE